MDLLPSPLRAKVEVTPRSAAEVAFLLNGLEIARARQGFSGGTFAREEQLTFGAGANETVLCEENEQLFLELLRRVASSRRAGGSTQRSAVSSAVGTMDGIRAEVLVARYSSGHSAGLCLHAGPGLRWRRPRHARSAYGRPEWPSGRHRTQGGRRSASAAAGAGLLAASEMAELAGARPRTMLENFSGTATSSATRRNP